MAPGVVSPLIPLRDEALLEDGDEDEESWFRLLSTLRDLRHCSGSNLFLGPPRPLRWLLLNRLISFPTDRKDSVSTVFGGLAGTRLPGEGVLFKTTSHWSPTGPSAGRGILGLLAVS